MNLDEKMDARQIVEELGMSDRPEFYSGRGAILGDINDRILEGVYQGILREHGEYAAQQYVQMVVEIPKLSATDYLLTLYRLEQNNWKWNKDLLGNENGVYIGPDRRDGSRESIAFASLIGTIFGDNSRDETKSIRRQFLERHQI